MSNDDSVAVRKVAEYLYKLEFSEEINEHLLNDLFMEDAKQIVNLVHEAEDADE